MTERRSQRWYAGTDRNAFIHRGAAATRSPESRTDPDATLVTNAQAGVIPE